MKIPTKFLVVITIMSLGTYAIADLSTGLIAHWEMEETSGDLAYDSTANDYDLGPVSGFDISSATTTGIIGKGFYFDSSSSRLAHGTLLDVMPSAITIAGWLKPMSGNGASSAWFQKQNIQTRDQLHLDVRAGGTFRARWRNDAADGGGAAMTTLDSGVSVVQDAWTHVAFTWDADGAEIFINGEPENSSSEGIMGDGTYVDLTLGTENFHLNPFVGVMDDVRIYNRVLTDDEIGVLGVPEPCTLLLLSLGGLVIRKRK
jgi:hypothetical protein